ncbi:hypothetical protein [Microseira wollei]|nr:hypothetical protein [Microseira wollei]
MELLLAHGADFHPRTRSWATPLSEAKRSFRSVRAAQLLQQAGATE